MWFSVWLTYWSLTNQPAIMIKEKCSSVFWQARSVSCEEGGTGLSKPLQRLQSSHPTVCTYLYVYIHVGVCVCDTHTGWSSECSFSWGTLRYNINNNRKFWFDEIWWFNPFLQLFWFDEILSDPFLQFFGFWWNMTRPGFFSLSSFWFNDTL